MLSTGWLLYPVLYPAARSVQHLACCSCVSLSMARDSPCVSGQNCGG